MTIRTLTNAKQGFFTLRHPAAWLSRLVEAGALRRSRRALSHLTPAQLADVGISPAQAEAEAARPFWDAPAHWQTRCR